MDEQLLARARALFPHTAQSKIYLNHAGTSPLSTRVVDAMTGYLQSRSAGVLDTYREDITMVAECRASVARLINAESAERIAFQTSTSDAINVLASGIAWKTGDRVLLGDVEFPANVYPYLNLKSRGVEIDFMKISDGRVTAGMIEERITPRTRLIALSAVQYLSGHRSDLRTVGELCRRKGIIFAVDAIQAVGAIQIDVQGMTIDFLAAGAQKWQMSPHGAGFLYITEELQSRIRQSNLGWLAVAHPWQFHDFEQPLASTARRYEGGSLNMPSLWGMHAAIRTLMEYDPAVIEAHILAITAELIEGFRKLDGVSVFTPVADAQRAGIVTIGLDPAYNPKKAFEYLFSHGLTAALRDGMLRFSPHFYNSAEEMRRTVELTAESLS